MLASDVGEAACGVRRPGECYAFDLGADRRERRADAVAAIEKSGEPSCGNRLPRRGDERPKPARTHIAAGVRSAAEHNLVP